MCIYSEFFYYQDYIIIPTNAPLLLTQDVTFSFSSSDPIVLKNVSASFFLVVS